MTNPFYVEPGNNMLPGLQALGNSIQKYGAIKREEDKRIRAEEKFAKIQSEAKAAIQSEDPQVMNEFAVQNPEWSQAMNSFMQWTSDGSRKNYLESAAEFRSYPTEENARRVTENRQKYLRSIGAKNTKQTDSFLEVFAADPDPEKKKALKSLDMSVASIANKDEWDRYAELAGIKKRGTESAPRSKLGQLNSDLDNGYIDQEEYEKAKKSILDGGEYAPTTLKKLIKERQELIDSGVAADSDTIKAYDAKIAGADTSEIDMSPESLAFWGYKMYRNEKMPSFGMGKGALKVREKIADYAAKFAMLEAQGEKVTPESLKEFGLTESEMNTVDAAMNSIEIAASTKAIQGSLNFLEKQKSSMGSFVENMQEQIKAVKEISDNLAMSDIKLLNKPWRTIRRYLGSAQQQKYDLFLGEITRENSKLATGSTQSIAAPAVEETKFWDRIHDKELSVKDMLELLIATAKAGDIRMASVNNAIEQAKQRLRKPATGGDTGSSKPIKSWKDY